MADFLGDGDTGRHPADAKAEAWKPAFACSDISGKEENRKAFYSFRTLLFMVYFDDAEATGQIRTIFPGFKISFGSRARLMLRITDTASPCSDSRKSILP